MNIDGIRANLAFWLARRDSLRTALAAALAAVEQDQNDPDPRSRVWLVEGLLAEAERRTPEVENELAEALEQTPAAPAGRE